jgi:hypothetical protein
MSDLSTVTSAIAGVKHAIDIAKLLRDSTTTLAEAETKLKLADLITALADTRVELATVQETLLAQERSIRELTEQLAFNGKMTYEKPYYWNVADDKRDGPFCQRCWDEKHQAIRLQGGTNGLWGCKVCGGGFKDGSYRPPDVNRGFRRGY